MSGNNVLRKDLDDVAHNDIDQLVRKDAEYGSSWKKRGGQGAFFMLARKFDRIEQQVKAHNYDIFAAVAADARPEGLRDDIGDLRRYLMLVETELMKPYNEVARRIDPTGQERPFGFDPTAEDV